MSARSRLNFRYLWQSRKTLSESRPSLQYSVLRRNIEELQVVFDPCVLRPLVSLGHCPISLEPRNLNFGDSADKWSTAVMMASTPKPSRTMLSRSDHRPLTLQCVRNNLTRMLRCTSFGACTVPMASHWIVHVHARRCMMIWWT